MTERRQFVGHTSTAESDQFTGLSREITIDMQAETIRVHDGTTPGGFPLARADLANISNTTIQNRITNKEEVSNKVSVLDENVTHEQYPDARVTYNELLTKANRDLSNLTDAGMDFIKSLGINETSESQPQGHGFAFKLGNGYVIQGGVVPAGVATISFAVEMADTNYMVLGCSANDDRDGFSFKLQSRSTTSFTKIYRMYENSHYHSTNNIATSWLVIGKYKQTEA